MSWLRIDDGFATHPKIGKLTDRQLRVWLRVLCYAARYQDPTIDEGVVGEVAGLDLRTIGRFAELGLLDQCNGVFEIHDWEDYLPSTNSNAERQARWRSRRNGHVTDA